MEQINAYSLAIFAFYLWISAVILPILGVASVRSKRKLRECHATQAAKLKQAQDQHERIVAELTKEHSRLVKEQEEAKELKVEELIWEHTQHLDLQHSEHKEALDQYSKIISMEDELARLEEQKRSRAESIESEMRKLMAQLRAMKENIEELREE